MGDDQTAFPPRVARVIFVFTDNNSIFLVS